jgi:hypothetical protein
VEWWSVFRAFVRDCFNKTREQMNRFYRESHPDAPGGTKWFPQPAKMEPPRPAVATPPIQIAVQPKRGAPSGGDGDRGDSPESPSRKRLRKGLAEILSALKDAEEDPPRDPASGEEPLSPLSDDESLLDRLSSEPSPSPVSEPPTLGPSDSPPLPPRSPTPVPPVPPIPPIPTVSPPPVSPIAVPPLPVASGSSDTTAPKAPDSRPPRPPREFLTPPRTLEEVLLRRSLRNIGKG